MPRDPQSRRRNSLRLPAFDYRTPGAYYVTIRTAGRRQLFGRVRAGRVLLSDAGRIAEEEWIRTGEIRANVRAGTYVIMPDHVHGVLWIGDRKEDDGRDLAVPRRFSRPRAGSLSVIVGTYKGAVTRRINRRRSTRGETVWQRNFYEHVVRDMADLERIRAYIADNPRRWSESHS